MDDLRVLYDLHGAAIFRFCRGLLGSRALAEEAVQETFLRAWRSSHRWDESLGGMRTWIHAIARNVCIDILRAGKRRPTLDHGTDLSDLPGIAAQGDADVDAVMSKWMIEEALNRIEPAHREAIVATYVNDRSYREIAEETGVSEATLRTRVFYGLKALRRALEEMGWHD